MSAALPVALVTGATRGLGSAIADALAVDHHVLVGGRDPRAVERRVAELPSASPFVADLADPGSLDRALADASGRLGALRVLVNNAGIARRLPIERTTRDDWEEILTTNVVAVADLTTRLLPHLRANRGTVVLINSGAGVRIYPEDAAYTVSKWALKAFGDCLRESERGALRVVSVHPGRIDTDMQRDLVAASGLPYDPAQHMSAADVARSIRLALDMPSTTNVDEVHMRTSEQRG
ncbi:SDR family oxidoreductase [Actinomyces sp. B33]|uniref:SDR family oxidoreductase n=1 Tax=Actinomyces sp. B33 TaxID=2942131 RepID=UPI00233FF7D0|nr:SDR family oxidoreductase [Actinomyces sp. B33]MDC4233273.1 SDR family oxidoreductase [Actinomyces sp. B33]